MRVIYPWQRVILGRRGHLFYQLAQSYFQRVIVQSRANCTADTLREAVLLFFGTNDKDTI